MEMEKRISKIITGKAGGTAGKGAKTYKVSLPTKWVSKLNLFDAQIEMYFDGEKITLLPSLSLSDFVMRKKALGHRLVLLQFYDSTRLCTKICADYTDQTISVEDHTDNIVKMAFGNNHAPTWADFERFLEERCIPKARSGIRTYLESIGVVEYDPLQIIQKTEGRMAEDQQWIQLEVIQ